jgi:hypothetical protein
LYFAFLILSSLAASALSGGVEVMECSGKKAGCVPTGTCLEPPSTNGQKFYIQINADASDFSIGVYGDSSCGYEMITLTTEDCAEGSCCQLFAYYQGQDVTSQMGPPLYLEYNDDECTPQPMSVSDSADGVIIKNFDARSTEMRSYISKGVEYSRNASPQTAGYSALAVGCLFVVGMVAGSGIHAVANRRSQEHYSHLPSVEQRGAISGYQTTSASEQSADDSL